MYFLPVTRLEIVNPKLQCVFIAMEDPWFCEAPTVNDLTKESLETYMKTSIDSILQLATTTYYKQNSITSGRNRMRGLVHWWQGKTREKEALVSFETQATKISSETNTIFANGLFDRFRVGSRQDQQLSSLHLDDNNKKF
jgi:hypothetical protein